MVQSWIFSVCWVSRAGSRNSDISLHHGAKLQKTPKIAIRKKQGPYFTDNASIFNKRFSDFEAWQLKKKELREENNSDNSQHKTTMNMSTIFETYVDENIEIIVLMLKCWIRRYFSASKWEYTYFKSFYLATESIATGCCDNPMQLSYCWQIG